MAQISTKSLEARITSAEMRLDNLQTNLRWQREGSQLAQVNPVNEIACLYQLLIDIAKSVNEIQKEWNRGNY